MFAVGSYQPRAALPAKKLLMDTGRELETMCLQDVHPCKMLSALLELSVGRAWFPFVSPCHLISLQRFGEESALPKSPGFEDRTAVSC